MTLYPDSLGPAASEDKPGLSDKQSQEGKPAGFPVAPAAALPKPPMEAYIKGSLPLLEDHFPAVTVLTVENK